MSTRGGQEWMACQHLAPSGVIHDAHDMAGSDLVDHLITKQAQPVTL